MKPISIFVSHSALDNMACRTVVSELRKAGADVWYDEHNLQAGELLDEIQRQLQARPIFIVLLSKAAITSRWVQQETAWAFNLLNREPNRLLLPITIGPIEPSDFNGTWLFLENMKRIEASSFRPFPLSHAIGMTLRALGLVASDYPIISVTPQPYEDFEAVMSTGRALLSQHRFHEAIPYFERGVNLEANRFDPWFELGYALGVIERDEEAIAAFESSLILYPGFAASWNNMGISLLRLSRTQDALQAFERALVINPNDASALLNMSTALLSVKQYPAALAACERALAIAPHAMAWGTLGSILNELHRNAEAVEAYSRSVALDPTAFSVWFNYGKALFEDGQFENALTAFNRSLALNPNRADTWALKGFAEGILEQFADSLASSNSSLALNNSAPLPWVMKANALNDLRCYTEALDAVDQAIGLEPTNYMAWRTKTFALAQLGRNEEALIACDNAMRLDSSREEMWIGRAQILRALGRTAEAVEAERHVSGSQPYSEEHFWRYSKIPRID